MTDDRAYPSRRSFAFGGIVESITNERRPGTEIAHRKRASTNKRGNHHQETPEFAVGPRFQSFPSKQFHYSLTELHETYVSWNVSRIASYKALAEKS